MSSLLSQSQSTPLSNTRSGARHNRDFVSKSFQDVARVTLTSGNWSRAFRIYVTQTLLEKLIFAWNPFSLVCLIVGSQTISLPHDSLQHFPLIRRTDEAVVQPLILIAETMTIKTEEMLDGRLQVADTYRIFQG